MLRGVIIRMKKKKLSMAWEKWQELTTPTPSPNTNTNPNLINLNLNPNPKW